MTEKGKEINIKGLIVAAGFSGRMKKFKPLLDYQGKPFVVTIAEKLASVCSEVVVVTGFNAHKVIQAFAPNKNGKLCKKIRFVFNKDYASGMFSSLQTGLRKCADSDWVIYHFVDQPSLPLSFYEEFITTVNDMYDWIQPEYTEIKGHPILLGERVHELIVRASENDDLRKVSRHPEIRKRIWSCDYPQVLSDVDTPEEYQSLIR